MFSFKNKKSILKFTKYMSSLPPNEADPLTLSEHISKTLSARVMTQGFPLLSAVGGKRARMVVIEHNAHLADKEQPTVLIGKGVTFDTGGYNIKTMNMEQMKFDKCGAMAVYSILKACHDQNYPGYVVGILPLAENLSGGENLLPSSIIKVDSKTSVEVMDTDAEGRLILADAIRHAKEYNPRAMITIATLTGSCAAALGDIYTGLFGNNAGLLEDLRGVQEDDLTWHMPIHKRHLDNLKQGTHSKVGTKILKNYNKREYGGSSAASFLNYFVEDSAPWAHLDIAGTAWTGHKATGRPTNLLLRYLEDILVN